MFYGCFKEPTIGLIKENHISFCENFSGFLDLLPFLNYNFFYQ